MKTKIQIIAILLLTIFLNKTNAQSTEKKGWDGTIKGNSMHVEIDENGNNIYFLADRKISMQNEQLISAKFDFKWPKSRVANPGSNGKRQHKPLMIRKSSVTMKQPLLTQVLIKPDENGDCDLSNLEAGTYTVCCDEACFSFECDSKKNYVGHVTLIKQ